MKEREKKIRSWFDMWLMQRDTGIEKLFAPDAIYTESWGPQYKGCAAIRHWFVEWNTRGKVLVWEIKQFFHQDNQTVVEWYFKNEMNDGRVEEFDGLSLVVWTEDSIAQGIWLQPPQLRPVSKRCLAPVSGGANRLVLKMIVK